MYYHQLHTDLNKILLHSGLDIAGKDNAFYMRFITSIKPVKDLFDGLYGQKPESDKHFEWLLSTVVKAYRDRSDELKNKDNEKGDEAFWYLSNKIAGMSLYVDRFCQDLKSLPDKLPYLSKLGINLLHLMPVFESPENAGDGGYAVSDFRKVDRRFGSLEDLKQLLSLLRKENRYLMLDIVLNHTSDQHEWALKAKAGYKKYQDYFYMFDDRSLPDQFEKTMPDIFPESSPGSFTWNEVCGKWVMTVFHHYQWDLNYTNPQILTEMLDTIFFYANLGVDILRIDAPAFIWKQLGTTSQNLPEAHHILRLIRLCTEIATPGMVLLGEAIVAPKEIMKYFGTEEFKAKECHFAYNATQMALQWDALASGDVRIMRLSQEVISQKPFGAGWITYTRCHDDIGLGYEDQYIQQAGFQPYAHRKFIKDYYSGVYAESDAIGSLFSVNPKTQDARISGSLASLCGLEKAIRNKDKKNIDLSIDKILMMQANASLIGGVPMYFYGDEAAYTNDYSYMEDPGKDYDNRWMHRPVINWKKNNKVFQKGTLESRLYKGIQKILQIRSSYEAFCDHGNIQWMDTQNKHIAGFMRYKGDEKIFCLFNYSRHTIHLSWYVFKSLGFTPVQLQDLWTSATVAVGNDHDFFSIAPFDFRLMMVK